MAVGVSAEVLFFFFWIILTRVIASTSVHRKMSRRPETAITAAATVLRGALLLGIEVAEVIYWVALLLGMDVVVVLCWVWLIGAVERTVRHRKQGEKMEVCDLSSMKVLTQ